MAETNEAMISAKERADKLEGNNLILKANHLQALEKSEVVLADLMRSRSGKTADRPGHKNARVHFSEDVDMIPLVNDGDVPVGYGVGFGLTLSDEAEDDMYVDDALPEGGRNATPGPSAHRQEPPMMKYSAKPASFTQERKMKTPTRVQQPLTPTSMVKRVPVTTKVRIVLLMHIYSDAQIDTRRTKANRR